jgi:hypothetical protein
MPRVVSKGSITGRKAFSNGGLGLSIGSGVGGARNAITRRAPDSGKSAEDSIYYHIYGGPSVKLSPGLGPDRPYISDISLNFDLNYAPSINMFTNKLEQIAFRFFPEDLSGNDAEITVSIYSINPSYVTESLFTTVSNNVYSITIPTMSDPILTGTEAIRYLDVTTEPQLLVSSDTNAKFEFDFSWSGVDLTDTDDFNRFTTMIDDITNKTYTFTLLANNYCIIQCDGPYYGGPYVTSGG